MIDKAREDDDEDHPIEAEPHSIVPAPQPFCDRLTCTVHVAHENCEAGATGVKATFQRLLKTTEQSFIRSLIVPSEGLTFPSHWIQEPGYLIIENKSGKQRRLTNPTEEEREKEADQIVKVYYMGDRRGFIIRPGGLFMAESPDVDQLVLMAVDQPVRVTISLFPN